MINLNHKKDAASHNAPDGKQKDGRVSLRIKRLRGKGLHTTSSIDAKQDIPVSFIRRCLNGSGMKAKSLLECCGI